MHCFKVLGIYACSPLALKIEIYKVLKRGYSSWVVCLSVTFNLTCRLFMCTSGKSFQIHEGGCRDVMA